MSARHLRSVTGDDGNELPPLERYEIYMRGAGLSARWIKDSLSTLRQLERNADASIESVTELDVSRFIGRENLSPNSRSAYFGQIAAFFKWYGQRDGRNVMVNLRRPKVPRSEPRPLTDAQLQRLLCVRMHRRTRVMILLAALAGLRVHEVAKVRGEDVDLAEKTLHVTGKGGHRASVPMHPLLVDAAQTMPRIGWWFPAGAVRPGEHARSKSVSQIIGLAMKRAEVPGTPHALRHWYGTALVSSGSDLRTTQTLLRHASLQTTQMYTAVSDDRRSAAVARLDPTGTGRPPAPAGESQRSPTTAVRKPPSGRADDTPRLVLKPDTPTVKTPKLILEVGTTNRRPPAVTIAELERAPKLTCEAPDHAGTARPAYAVTWRSASLCCAEPVTLGTQLMCAQCQKAATADGWSCQRCDSHDLPASTWVESTRQL